MIGFTEEELEAWDEYVVKTQNNQGFNIGRVTPLRNDAPKRRIFIEGYRAGKIKGEKNGKLSKRD